MYKVVYYLQLVKTGQGQDILFERSGTLPFVPTQQIAIFNRRIEYVKWNSEQFEVDFFDEEVKGLFANAQATLLDSGWEKS